MKFRFVVAVDLCRIHTIYTVVNAVSFCNKQLKFNYMTRDENVQLAYDRLLCGVKLLMANCTIPHVVHLYCGIRNQNFELCTNTVITFLSVGKWLT